MSKPVFGYWNIRGYAQPMRFMIAYLGIEVEEKRYELDQAGFDEWSKTDKFNLGMDFPNLPYWKEDGWSLTETRAILRYIAREKSKDLMPTTPELMRKADMLENVLWDVWWHLITCCISYTEEAKEKFASTIPTSFKLLNDFIGTNKFLLGDQLSFVDFFLYEVLNHYTTYDPECVKPYPGLVRLCNNFEALPAIAKYLKSPEFIKSPCYHPIFMTHKI